MGLKRCVLSDWTPGCSTKVLVDTSSHNCMVDYLFSPDIFVHCKLSSVSNRH